MSRPPSSLGPPPGKSAGDSAYAASIEQVRLLLKQHAGVPPPSDHLGNAPRGDPQCTNRGQARFHDHPKFDLSVCAVNTGF
eukprot:5878321-Amphidinium_carterae.1